MNSQLTLLPKVTKVTKVTKVPKVPIRHLAAQIVV
jgi:hypothetical protein